MLGLSHRSEQGNLGGSMIRLAFPSLLFSSLSPHDAGVVLRGTTESASRAVGELMLLLPLPSHRSGLAWPGLAWLAFSSLVTQSAIILSLSCLSHSLKLYSYLFYISVYDIYTNIYIFNSCPHRFLSPRASAE